MTHVTHMNAQLDEIELIEIHLILDFIRIVLFWTLENDAASYLLK